MVAAPVRVRPVRLARAHALIDAVEAGWVVLLAAAAFWMLLVVAFLPVELVQDSYLALVSGREVALHGLPQHDALTIWTLGARWIDQQWLGQLFYYGLARVGGIRMVMLTHALVLVSAFVFGLRAARRLGASVPSVVLCGMAAISVAPWALQMRTQDLGELFFVLLVWLLAADSRRPSRRVYLTLPLLLLWANVHGSVLFGSLLVALRALTVVIPDRRGTLDVRSRVPRAVPLLVGAAVAPFASPYGLSLIGYYRQLLANPLLRAFVNEWRASTPSIRTVAFYLVALATIWLLGRNGRHVTWFERLTLLFTLCAGAAAIRSIVWFGLAALVLLPSLLQPTLRGLDFAHFRRFARPLAFCAALTIAATAAYAGTRPADWFTSRWPVAQSGQIETLAEHSPNGRVFADDRYADWLLWNYPQLRGRVAYDVRFELFDARSFLRLESFRDRIGDGWRSAAAGYDLIVADPTQQHEVESGLLADRFTTAVQAPKLVVLTRQDPIRSARSITAARLAPSALGHEHAGNLSTEALAHK